MIREMFTLMDTDNDGKVSYDELRAGLRKVGSQLADPEIKLLMEVVKKDTSLMWHLVLKFFCFFTTFFLVLFQMFMIVMSLSTIV